MRRLLAVLGLTGVLALAAQPAYAAPSDPSSIDMFSLAVQSDGKVIVSGIASGSNYSGTVIMRINPDGSRDTTFQRRGLGIAGAVHTMAIQPDGRQVLVRLLPDGTRDPNFSLTPAVDSVESVALMSDGRLVIGGSLSHSGGYWGFVMRLDAHGRPDISFQPALLPNVQEPEPLAIQSDGSVLTAYYGMLLRFGSDGQFRRLATPVGFPVSQMAGTPEGVIVASRSIRDLPGLVRIRPDGTADTQFSQVGTALRPVSPPETPLRLRIVPRANRWVISWQPSPTAMGYSVRLGRGKPCRMTDGTVLEVPRRAGDRMCVRAVNPAGSSAWVCRRGATP